jgi:hypothetical protein
MTKKLLNNIVKEFNECFNTDSEKTFEMIKKDIELGSLNVDKNLKDKFTRYIMNGCELIYYTDIKEFLINKKVIRTYDHITNDDLMDKYIDYMLDVYIQYSILNK